MNKTKLSELEHKVLYENGTEPPHQNQYWNFWAPGIFVHKISRKPLFSSYDKYLTHCGWPTFYQSLDKSAIAYVADHSHNMIRTEIRDQASDTHLGHVFDDLSATKSEQFSFRRYCLNSAALDFIPESEILTSDNDEWKQLWQQSKTQHYADFSIITIGGGCFWGVQHLLRHLEGIYDTKVGYANFKDQFKHVSYKQVCELNTGAVEVVQIFYNKKVLPLVEILSWVFKYVDPTTLNRQGNDVGSQYRSGVYYSDQADAEVISDFFQHQLQPLYDRKIVTEILPLTKFVLAEDYHQDYLVKNPNGYCHIKF